MIKCTIEYDYDVQKEEYIYAYIDRCPNYVICLSKCNSVGCYETCEKENKCDHNIPLDFEFIIRHNQKSSTCIIISSIYFSQNVIF